VNQSLRLALDKNTKDYPNLTKAKRDWGPAHFEFNLYRVRDRDLVPVFYLWIYSFPNTVCILRLSFMLLAPLPRAGSYSCVGAYIRLFCSFHWSIDLFFCRYYATFVTMILLYKLKSGIVLPPVLLFLLKIAFWVSEFLVLSYEFRIDFSISVKNYIGILMLIALNLWITFSSVAIFTILVLPVHEHRMSFHLLGSSSIFFLQCFIVVSIHVFYLFS
jgi:hypothetical protein